MKKLYSNTLMQLILALCTFSFVACQEFDIDSQPEGPLNIQIDALESYTALATSPSNVVFNISSNTPWTIESDQQWCKPTPSMSAASSLVSEIVVTMENNTGDYKKTIESAVILGKITQALKDYDGLEENGIIEKWFSKESLENGIIKMEDLINKLNLDNPYREKFEKDLQDKINMSKDLLNNFDFEMIRKMTIMNSHGDYSVQQLIYKDNGETTVIDFETAKKLPIIWEVMRSYSYIDEKAKNGELHIDTLEEYVKEFENYVPLNEYDLKYAAQLYLIQIVSSTFGYKQYNDNYAKTELLEFALFRTNLCRYLYNNLEKISARLQE